MDFLPAPARLDPPVGELHLWRLHPSPLALRRVLAAYLGLPPEGIQLAEGEHGKPRLADPQGGLGFNLSHSGELALVVVSDGLEVGVDVERIRPKREGGFYWRWACREAESKCLGTGVLGARQATGAAVAVRTVAVGDGYAGAVAAAGAQLPPLRGFIPGPPLPEDG